MAAPYQTTPHESHSRRRAALLRALGGIAARGPELGTDPFGSFQAGLRGALSTGDEQQAREDQQTQLDMVNRSRRMEAQAAYERASQERGGYGVAPWYENPENPIVTPELRDRYRTDALYHGQPGQAQDPYAATQDRLRGEYEFLRDNPAARALGIGSATAPAAPRQMSPWQTAQVRAWMAQHPGSSVDDAMAGLTYNRPVVIGGEFQARDDFGPVYIGPDGRATNDPVDRRTGQPNRPMMIQSHRQFGVPGQQGGGADPGGLR